jgi:Tetratricopeptide repeat
VPQPTHLTAVQQNARALRGSGDLAGARLMLEQGLAAAKAGLGEDHPEVLSTAHLLAGMHREAGEPAAARRVLEEAVAAGQRRYGDGEPVLLALAYALGTIADELGNRHEARRNLGRVAAAGPAVLGEDHPWVRAARGYLGGVAAPPLATRPGTPATVPPTPPPATPPRATPLPVPATPPPPPATPLPVPATPPPPPATPPPYQERPHPSTTSPYPQPTHPPPYGMRLEAPEPPTRRGRGATVAAAVAATVAVLAATVAATVVLTGGRGGDAQAPQAQGTTQPASDAAAVPPGRVRLSDERSAVTLSWADSAGGRAPFIVAGGRAGEQPRALGEVPAGQTRYELNGLNPNLEYCFVVIAVYSADQLLPSEQVCTERSPSPVRPSGSGR